MSTSCRICPSNAKTVSGVNVREVAEKTTVVLRETSLLLHIEKAVLVFEASVKTQCLLGLCCCRGCCCRKHVSFPGIKLALPLSPDLTLTLHPPDRSYPYETMVISVEDHVVAAVDSPVNGRAFIEKVNEQKELIASMASFEIPSTLLREHQVLIEQLDPYGSSSKYNATNIQIVMSREAMTMQEREANSDFSHGFTQVYD